MYGSFRKARLKNVYAHGNKVRELFGRGECLGQKVVYHWYGPTWEATVVCPRRGHVGWTSGVRTHGSNIEPLKVWGAQRGLAEGQGKGDTVASRVTVAVLNGWARAAKGNGISQWEPEDILRSRRDTVVRFVVVERIVTEG